MASNNANNVDDWKATTKTQKERLKFLLESGHASDVQFLVGNEKNGKELFNAHKFVLGTIGSSIFEAEFHFNKSIGRPKNEPIKLPDIKPDAFKAMLKFLYLEEFSGIKSGNIAFVFDLAKKYLLPALANKCINMALIDGLLNFHNVLDLLDVAKLYEEKILLDGCWLFIDRNIADFVESDVFLTIGNDELCEIFARDTLQCDELTLFHGLDRWAEKQCQNMEESTGEQKRALIGSALNEIRLPLISSEDFSNEIVPTNILSADELEAMSLFYSGNTIDEVKDFFPLPLFTNCCTTPRNNESNVRDYGSGLILSENGLVVTKSETYPSLSKVRYLPIPKLKQNAVKPYIAFYFEVKIIKRKKAIAIGFCDKNFSMEDYTKLGDAHNSIGFWCKSAMKINGLITNFGNYHYGYGRGSYRLRAGDIIGIGLIHYPAESKLTCFATCDLLLGVIQLPETFVELQLFPAASLTHHGDSIRVNFGKQGWRYDPSHLV